VNCSDFNSGGVASAAKQVKLDAMTTAKRVAKMYRILTA